VVGAVPHSLPLHLLAVVLVPTLLAFIISFAMFKRRVGGVYFAIITQAVALILTVLIIGQQGYTGGVNGITDLKTMLGWDIRTDSAPSTSSTSSMPGLLLGQRSCCAAGSS
jgi:urea transport system permease protein